MTVLFECSCCGRRLQVSETYRGQRTKCPVCNSISVVPGTPEHVRVARPADPRHLALDDEDTLGVVEEGPTCPECRVVLPPGGVLCVHCGYDFRTRRRRETSRGPFEERWDVGLPLIARILILAFLEMIVLVVAVFLPDVFASLALVFAATVFLSLGLGTSIKLRLICTESGKVLLRRTWCICFIPAIHHQINARKYDVILIDSRGRDWGLAVFSFLLYGLLFGLLGLIWWTYWRGDSASPSSYRISLRKDHSREEFLLYYSRDDRQLKDIVDTLQEATGMRIDRK
jgi:hypothetical protein